MVTNIVKWTSIPALLCGSVLSYCVPSYEFLVDFFIGLAALFFLDRAVGLKEYAWAGALIGIVIVSSPFLLAGKVFTLLAISVFGACASLIGACRSQPRLIAVIPSRPLRLGALAPVKLR